MPENQSVEYHRALYRSFRRSLHRALYPQWRELGPIVLNIYMSEMKASQIVQFRPTITSSTSGFSSVSFEDTAKWVVKNHGFHHI
jgi:hypothetical protein